MSKYNEQLAIFEAKKAGQGKVVNVQILERGLKEKLTTGEVTEQDVEVALHVAKSTGSTRARALYSKVKRAAQQSVEQTEKVKEIAKVVENEVATSAEMETLLRQVEHLTAGSDSDEARSLLDNARKLHAFSKTIEQMES